MHWNKKIVTFMGVCLSCMAMSATYFVNSTGSDDNGGLSWDGAFKSIGKPLSLVSEQDQIWVAKGTYTSFDDQFLKISSNVSLYGGFSGSESHLEDRDTVLNEVIVDQSKTGWTIWNYGFVDGVSFTGSQSNGAAIVAFSGAIIQNCRVYGNKTTGVGVMGGTVRNCYIYDNHLAEDAMYQFGGGVDVDSGTLQDCVIYGNSNYGSGGGVSLQAGSIINCDIYENRAYAVHLNGSQNGYLPGGGGIYVHYGTVSNCNVFCNYSGQQAGGIYNCDGTVSNCRIFQNESRWYGGGIVNEESVQNCLIYNNISDERGAGMMNFGLLQNCTVTNNTSLLNASGIENGTFGSVNNCIVWNNTGVDILNHADASSISYSCFSNSVSENGNINLNPMFLNNQGNLSSRDFHLHTDSPCVDTASSENVPETDLDGVPRPQQSGIDMGAYEYTAELNPSFTVSCTEGMRELTVNFYDYSSGNPISWAWDFDNDGVIDSNEPNPSWNYSVPGVYSVSFSISKDQETKSITRTQYICVKNVYFVSKEGNDNHSGLSWSESLASITAALNKTDYNDVIWVAEGIYQEGHLLQIDYFDQLYGGFSGSETALSQRNIAQYVTQVDGQKSHQCILNYGLLDGFTVNNGIAENGGGIENYSIINNSKVYDCNAEKAGGGIYNHAGGILLNSEVYMNQSFDGGGVFSAKNGLINKCIISNNAAENGGGIYSLHTNFWNNRIYNNHAQSSGGGAYVIGLKAYNSLIYANWAVQRGGAIYAESQWGILCDHLTVAYNHAYESGSGIDAFYGEPIIYNSILWGNGNDDVNYPGSETIYHSCFPAATYHNGNTNLDPHFMNDSGGVATWDFRLKSDSPCINSGLDEYLQTYDLDDRNRLEFDPTDMGCFEYHDLCVEISADQTMGTASLPVQFSAQSDSEIIVYQWDFDNDGSIDSTLASPLYTYLEPGIYSVTLSVQNEQRSYQHTWENYIRAYDENVPELSAELRYTSIPSEMFPGIPKGFLVTMKNTGSETWLKNGGVKLGAIDNEDPFSSSLRYNVRSDIRFGDEYSFLITMDPMQEGDFLTDWQMLKEGAAWFGDKLEKQVHVESSTDVSSSMWTIYQ